MRELLARHCRNIDGHFDQDGRRLGEMRVLVLPKLSSLNKPLRHCLAIHESLNQCWSLDQERAAARKALTSTNHQSKVCHRVIQRVQFVPYEEVSEFDSDQTSRNDSELEQRLSVMIIRREINLFDLRNF